MATNSSRFTAEKYYSARTGDMKRKYTQAAKANDAQTMAEVRKEWADTQAAKKGLGFDTAPLSDLLKAPADQRKRESRTLGGVQYNQGNRGFIEALQ
jgi:hypothetical protein